MTRNRSELTEYREPLLAEEHHADEDAEEHYGTVSRSCVESTTFTRNLGAFEAFGIVISIVIGSGVFTSPGQIDTNVPSPGMALVIWLVGGLLAWTGASTLAELGTAIPGEGGVQPYLAHIFGDVVGFMAAWTWIVAVMPATLAILSIVFVESAYSAAGITDQAASVSHKVLAVLILVIMSVANSISTKASTRLNSFFVAVKFLSIFCVVAAGLAVVGVQSSHPNRRDVGGRDWVDKSWFAPRTSSSPGGGETDWTELGQWEMFGHYSAALYGALWAYSGWDKAIYVSAELSNPARQLPLALNGALLTSMVSFLAANAAYYILLPWKVVSTTDSAAVTAFTRLLGKIAGIAAAVLICIVVAGALLGNSFVAGRMAVAAARKRWIPSVFAVTGRVGPGSRRRSVGEAAAASNETTTTQSDAPVNSLMMSAALAALYIIFGNFRALITLNGLGEYSFFFLTVLGAVILRFREPDLDRPYKPFIIVPILFILVSGFVVVRGAIFAPVQAAVIAGVWGLGLVYYWVRSRLSTKSSVGVDHVSGED